VIEAAEMRMEQRWWKVDSKMKLKVQEVVKRVRRERNCVTVGWSSLGPSVKSEVLEGVHVVIDGGDMYKDTEGIGGSHAKHL